MKQILLVLISLTFLGNSFSQTCNSFRYRDTLFHNVTVTTYKFGTAIQRGLLALPQDLYLDFYEPTGDTLSKRPLIIFQFGGGFTIGWRSEPDIPQFCTYFAKCGYAVASIDYRIGLDPLDTSSTVRAFYRGVQDERSAIRYLCQRFQQFKIDTSLIILTGTSAGCFCAFANSFMADSDQSSAVHGSFLEPSDLGCMDCSGNTDFNLHIPHIKAIVNQWGAIIDTSFIEQQENTPVISFHGDQDILVPYIYGYPFQLPVFPKVYGSVPIHQRLNNLGILNELHTLVGYGHEPELLAPQLNDTIYNHTRIFLYKLLKPATSAITGDTTVCAKTVAEYSVANTSGSKYCWSISGNGNIIKNTGNSISVLWIDTGTVSVAVKELNSILTEGDVQSFSTFVTPPAKSDFNFSANQLDVFFTNLSANANSFLWNFGDNTSSIVADTITKKYQTGGNYPVQLIASNKYCSDTSTAHFVIDSCPAADITYQINNRNVFFYSPATNTVSYFWNFGDGDSASVHSPNVFHQYTQDGEYIILLQVQNQLECKVTDTVRISVGDISSVETITDNIKTTVTSNNIYISNAGIADIEIYDVSGKKLLKKNIFQNIIVSIEDIANGVYYMVLRKQNKIQVVKFFK